MSILQQTQMNFIKCNIKMKFSKNLSLEIKKLLNTITLWEKHLQICEEIVGASHTKFL